MRRRILPLLFLVAGCKIGGNAPQSGSGYVPPPPAGQAQCTSSAVCTRVVPTRPAPPLAGRLIVLWAPIGDDDPRFVPELGYDAPFFGTERTAIIPYSAIRPPRGMQWFPACLDRRPECNHLAGVATGYVLVVPNTGAPVNPMTVSKGAISAAGRLIVGFGTQPIAPGGALRDEFPNGIAGGLAPYALVRPQQGSFDKMWLAQPGTWFDLVSCTAADPGCDLPMPNLN